MNPEIDHSVESRTWHIHECAKPRASVLRGYHRFDDIGGFTALRQRDHEAPRGEEVLVVLEFRANHEIHVTRSNSAEQVIAGQRRVRCGTATDHEGAV